MKRNEIIDIMKSIAIVFVVIGHTGAFFSGFLYLFHIAIFILISGYLFNYKTVKSFTDLKCFIINKIVKLYIPFVGINVLGIIINNLLIKIGIYSEINNHFLSFSEMLLGVIKVVLFHGETSFFGGTWFLRLLFEITVIYAIIDYILKKFSQNNRELLQGIISIAFLLLGFYFINSENENFIVDIQFFTCYFLFYLGKKIINCENKFKKHFNKNILLIFYFFLLFILNNIGEIEISKNQYTNIPFFIAVSIIGFLFIYQLANLIEKNNYIKAFSIYIGRNSLVILSIHLSVIYIFNYIFFELFEFNSNDFVWIIPSFLGVIIPLLIRKIYLLIKGGFKIEIRSSNSNI